MIRKIDKGHPLSYYHQLKQIIIDMINNGKFSGDDKLPTEKELCQKFDVSRSTVRKALDSLENEGYIYKVQGKGSFVSSKKLQQDLLQFYSFTNEIKKKGKEPSSKVLEFNIKNSMKKHAEKLNINVNENIYEFTRLRLADNEPMMVETTYIPCYLFPDLKKNELETTPLYTILTERYGAVFSKAEETFQATLLRKEEAKLLNYVEGGAGFLLERTTYNNQGEIIEFTKSVARGDKFEFRVVLEK